MNGSVPPSHVGVDRARRHPIKRDQPAPDFFEGALLGNGGLGVVVTTRPDAIVLRFGHNSVWDIRLAEDHADELGTFDDVFRRIAAIPASDEPLEADPWYGPYRQLVLQNYFKPYPRPFPCGSLVLGFSRRNVELLGHDLDIADGMCRVRLLVDSAPATVEIFVDQDHDRLWVRYLDRDGHQSAAPFDRIRLVPDPDGLKQRTPGDWTTAEEVQTDPGPGVEVPTTLPTDHLAFRYVLPVSLDPEARAPGDRAFRLSLRAPAALVTNDRPTWFGKREGMKCLERAWPSDTPLVLCLQLDHGLATEVDASVGMLPVPSLIAFDAAAASASESWRQYWERSSVALADEDLERTWYWNTYFLNCALRAGQTCPGLFGNWSYRGIGTVWHGDYHMNYNTQQVFWGVFSSNRVEHHLPYVELVDLVRPLARSWAKDYYGMRGGFFPHSAYPVPMKIPAFPGPAWGWEVCETPWTVQSLWWHYLYTMDEAFLRDRGMPPIREATEFLIDYITRPDARGERWDDDRWHIFPTVPPELYELKRGWQLNYDCLADLTLTRFALNAYLDACDVLGIQEAEAQTMAAARDVLVHLPEYARAATPEGDVLVSVPGEDPDVVYNVPLPAMIVFPGEEHGLHSSPEDYALAVRTQRRQQLEGGNELVFANLQAARLGTLDLARFTRQIAYCELPNGTCTDMALQVNGRYTDDSAFDFMAAMGVFVENFALPAVVNECLLQSYTGVLRFFPNWPSDTPAEFRTFRAVGAFLVSARLDGVVRWIEIFSERGGALRLIVPWAAGARCTRPTGEVLILHGEAEIQTAPGESLRLTSAE